MNLDQLDPVFLFAAVLCAVMALVSSFRRKSRGVSALFMSGAFLVLGAAMLMVRAKAPLPLLAATGALLLGLLIAEFATRAGQAYDQESKP